MKRAEIELVVAEAVRTLTLGTESAAMAKQITSFLSRRGLEIRPKSMDRESKIAREIEEHETWASRYELESVEFEAAGNEMGAENRRKMARESRARAARLRGEAPVKA